jgi:hypothetical protein
MGCRTATHRVGVLEAREIERHFPHGNDSPHFDTGAGRAVREEGEYYIPSPMKDKNYEPRPGADGVSDRLGPSGRRACLDLQWLKTVGEDLFRRDCRMSTIRYTTKIGLRKTSQIGERLLPAQACQEDEQP